MSSSAAVPASADASARYLRPHYAPGVPGVIAPVTEPLSCMLDDAARRFPDRVALDFLGRPTTYRRLSEQVDHAAEALRRLGVGRGDVVGVILPNCPQHVVIAYAAWRIGAIIAEQTRWPRPRKAASRSSSTADASSSPGRSPWHASSRPPAPSMAPGWGI